MTQLTKRVALAKAEVKDQLAEKYIRLAKAAGSKPKRRTYLHQVRAFRNQAQEIRRGVGE